MVTRMREKGQVTIPAQIRQLLHLGNDSILSVTKVGDGILLTPKPSVFEDVSKKFAQAAKKKSISLDDLLSDLKKLRRNR